MAEENLKKEKTGGNENPAAADKKGNSQTERAPFDIRPYLSVALTVILIVVVCMIVFFLIFRFDGLKEAVQELISILQAVIIGFVVAYLINPIMKKLEKPLKKGIGRTNLPAWRKKRLSRALATAGALVIFLLVIAAFLVLLIPQLISSVQNLVLTMGDKLDTLMEWISRFTKDGGELAGLLNTLATDISDYIVDWLEENILNQEFISTLTSGVYNVLKFLLNILIGIIISVYILMKKEVFIGQTKKLIYAVFRPRWANAVIDVLRRCNEVFGGFFIGKIIDSVIIGFICFVCLYLMNMPYTALVSTIVGVTNIIPFFGPYIGAIPSFILIFLEDPIKSIEFLVFIIILQQFDGNILGPKILGNSTGLSPFWIVFAILLFGGIFGVTGMIVGVPVFAVIYYIIRRIADHFLRKKGLPIPSSAYEPIDYIDPKTNTVYYKDPDKKTHYLKTSRFWRKVGEMREKKQAERSERERKEEEKTGSDRRGQ